MDDKGDIIGEDGVVIKQEHAYASKDDKEILPNSESSEDPLKIMPYDVEKVKIEDDTETLANVEIKMESDSEGENEFNFTPKSDVEVLEYNVDINEPSSMDNTEVIENPFIGDNMNFDGCDFVPKTVFMDLQNKYKNMYNHYTQYVQQKKTFSSENETLKKEITKLKKDNKNKFSNVNIKKFQRDFKGAQILGNNLKFEINNLAKQNLFLRKKLIECQNVIWCEDAMEKSILRLKDRVETFANKERISYTDFNNMKFQLEYKEQEQKIMENRLHHAIIKLENLKQKLFDNSKLRKLYYESRKQKEKLQKELTDCMKVRYLYEDHADLIKKEMNSKLKEKEAEMEKYRKEIEKLSKICFQNESTGKLLKDKLKNLNQTQESKMSEAGRMYLHEKQKSATLQEKILEKHNENVVLRKDIAALKVELEKYQSANLQEKVIEKQRENVTLREEIAMLKVELEKIAPRTLLC